MISDITFWFEIVYINFIYLTFFPLFTCIDSETAVDLVSQEWRECENRWESFGERES